MLTNVTQRGCTQQGVHDGMDDGIRIRMTRQTIIMGIVTPLNTSGRPSVKA
ncbi:hypothetical protein KDW_32960 [Dictyobacter vulcani]|uniref:Uncharacterized protein n=1 Tax=Dictyobacter vulcani TaxID=2607529 RepID=A0A5J4KI30_9CHLR|nr:hypothetical protein KDW_32960 [Dictyobacter vulcani]